MRWMECVKAVLTERGFIKAQSRQITNRSLSKRARKTMTSLQKTSTATVSLSTKLHTRRASQTGAAGNTSAWEESIPTSWSSNSEAFPDTKKNSTGKPLIRKTSTTTATLKSSDSATTKASSAACSARPSRGRPRTKMYLSTGINLCSLGCICRLMR